MVAFLDVETSCRGLRWQARCEDEAAITQLEQLKSLDNLSARLLAGRGITPDIADEFLSPTLRGSMPDPSSLQDMDKAAKLILDAIEAKQKITVFADYDVDGGSSAAQLIKWGRAFGVEIGLYVPDRVKEGYGPSVEAFERLKADGNDLVITVDCGAAAQSALEAAKNLELPIIVIDHHLMQGALPPCAALVNPNREDDTSGLGHLAAAGVTFMTLVALNREARRRGLENTPNIMKLLGLSAIGTVCDVVSLKGLNRTIVSQGLKVLSQDENIGIRALSDVAGTAPPYTTYHCGFILGPRINAGGRIGKAEMGAEMLSTENAQLAYAHAAELDRVNTERKALQKQIVNEALEEADKLANENSVMIVSMDGWHPGVIGIVAGRLKDRFDKPAIVIGLNEEGLGKGSGRSMPGVNLGDAITKAKEAGLLISGGGHAMAGGLTVEAEKIEALTEFLNRVLADDVAEARKNLSLKIDSLLALGAASQSTIDRIAQVAPYGAGNPQPVFAFSDLRISYAERVKGGHVRCAFEDGVGGRISGICFRADETGLDEVLLSPNAPRVHVAGRLKADSWKGRNRVDLQVVDIAIA
ncbi:single-stranded-DNA-specific exonuclease RecJ [Hellea balneolensis]|uniref:single-stranded-DNA-specific exonuclease RecJ n=1 Tax=Hellea balneolensis TaxID=287478 RepID=UPI00042A26B3|nr:single-stranded-DNA-specific exonuclease RecJ [Hellea balneolensis]